MKCQYEGKLYSKIGRRYIDTGRTSEDWDRMESAIRETIEENLHLADGDVCTLKKLKDAINFSPTKPCPRCHGEGYYFYDETHASFCTNCCDHKNGWWTISKEYHGSSFIDGGDNGCCRTCGLMRRDLTSDSSEAS